MKRLLPILPFFVLLLLNACGNYPVGVSPSEGTAVGKTQTAVAWTPTISPTPVPNQSKIVEWLNTELSNADDAMKKRGDKIIEQVPLTVSWMKVICYDHMNQFAIVSASWADVKSYLQGQINGYQFGARVIRGDAP